MPAFLPFLMKLKVTGWKESTVQVHSCKFCHIFKNDYVAVHVRTAASDILEYPHVGISIARSTLKKCTVFSSIFLFIYSKLILESCTTSRVVFRTISNIYDEVFSRCIFQETLHHRYLQGSKYDSAALFFNIFQLFLFGYLNEYMNILSFFWKCAATLLMWFKSKILYNVLLVPKLFALYWPWKYQNFIYLDREAKKLTLKNFQIECKADIYY